MSIRVFGTVAVVLGVAAPAWAHCGVCGSDGKKEHPAHDHTSAIVGEPAPDFTLEDLDGRAHKLSELEGKVVVLEWTNHECPFVKRTHGKGATVNRALENFEGKPVVWLAINSSHFAETKAGELRQWAKDNGLSYPVLLDASGEVGRLYGAKTTPHLFVVDQKGVLAYAGALDNDPYGNEKNKLNYVEEAVTALLSGSTVAKATTQSYGCSVKYKK